MLQVRYYLGGSGWTFLLGYSCVHASTGLFIVVVCLVVSSYHFFVLF